MSYFDRWRQNHPKLLRNIESSMRTKGILLIASHHNYFRETRSISSSAFRNCIHFCTKHCWPDTALIWALFVYTFVHIILDCTRTSTGNSLNDSHFGLRNKCISLWCSIQPELSRFNFPHWHSYRLAAFARHQQHPGSTFNSLQLKYKFYSVIDK